MYFDSFSEIISMAGHGAYVWTTYGISVLVLGTFIVVPVRGYKKEMMRLRERAKKTVVQ